jgi:O-antigen ligase
MSGAWRSPLVGVVLLVLLAAWTLLPRADATQTGAMALAHLAAAAGLLTGFAAGRRRVPLSGWWVVAGMLLVLVVTGLEALTTTPLWGYANATSALGVCGAAAGVLATRHASPRARALAASAALLVAAMCWSVEAQASTVAALVLAGWAVARHRGPAAAWVAASVVLVVVPALLPVGWGASWWDAPRLVVRALSRERFQLWNDAVGMTVDHPGLGVGAGGFRRYSPTATDPDLAWAHSVWLQESAELGLVGLALLGLLVAWAVASLGRDAVLLAVLLLPGAIDYVFHFGGVLLASSFVVGGWLGSSSGRGNPWLTPPSP